ncbi:porin [[Haemophilus] ducreyi]|uniref:porin n=1 Tax=Haemophilus ducreyi TaxID=730 RepID=UPI000654FDD7|nr:porin [[Haemophilus] ducreyi]AKO45390.1 membrane protein [[Haemophilus] ducreyi]AKO46775.1 membrane protein [[Haemophilus] ducreyi]AKO48116.1 membrane protein [[Haemophilus] ducreyi]AKO49502.1 membrane protein [[Haemophilus] ducreyi]ANF61461.1 hypothetical protein A6037_01090 [[Haemophilus] ducreyi]
MNRTFNKTLLACLITVSGTNSQAASFQLAEISTSGLGMAYAGNAAVADNASVVATNPALMTEFKRPQISVGGILVDANVDVSGKINGSIDASHKDIIPNAIVPNIYFVTPINSQFSLGGGLNVNYGLKSQYNDKFNGGMFGGSTKLTALNFNLSGAYNLGNGISLGLGLNAIHSDAEINRYLGAGKQILIEAGKEAQAQNIIPSLSENTSIAHIKGKKWSLGWNVGLAYQLDENHRWGVAYHAPVDVKFSGQYSNQLPEALNPLLQAHSSLKLPISQATGGKAIPGNLTLNLPAYWELSGFHKLTDQLAMQYSYKYTGWKRLKSLDAYANDGTLLFQKIENFSNSSRYAIGFSYDVAQDLTLRTGFAYDKNASVKHPSISIPDTTRTWYSIGATYRFTPNVSFDVGLAHLRGKKNQFTEGTLVKGAFEVAARANLYGLSISYGF